MGLIRIGVLLRKEFVYGSKGFIFLVIFAPLLLSLSVNLIFGDLTFIIPRAGLYDRGESGIRAALESETSIRVVEFGSESALIDGVRSGEVDVGIALPDEFDRALAAGRNPEARLLFYGESYAKDRLIISAALIRYGRSMSGQRPAFTVDSVVVGDSDDLPWNERLLPFIVLMTLLMSGIFLPGTSLISEKEHGTLQALGVTPAAVGEVFVAKGILAFIVCFLMGVIILVLNSAFGAKPALLLSIMALGAVMSVTIGLILGAALKDVASLFAFWKSAAIVLFAPGIIYLFPSIPQWIGKIFPTYYLIAPINKINLDGAGWSDIATDIGILIAVNCALVLLLAAQISRSRKVVSS